MAVELPSAGYQDIRDYVEDNWIYISLEDDTGSEIFRISTADSRVSWIHTAESQELQLQVNITGSDSEFTLPQKFSSSALYKVSSGGNILSEEGFTTTTLETTADTLTITHNVQIPQL